MTLKEMRTEKGLTQAQCAQILGMPLRTYQNYESREKAGAVDMLKYKYICNELQKYGQVDEEHGMLTVEKIKSVCAEVFKNCSVDYCYLFGSYAKGKQNETSDVDLLVNGSFGGLEFYGMAEELRSALKKRVDLLLLPQIAGNAQLLNEILKDGIRIYG